MTESEQEMIDKFEQDFYGFLHQLSDMHKIISDIYACAFAAVTDSDRLSGRCDWNQFKINRAKESCRKLDHLFPDGIEEKIIAFEKRRDEINSEIEAEPFNEDDYGVKNSDFVETVNNPVTGPRF